jgi:hypothetical protein
MPSTMHITVTPKQYPSSLLHHHGRLDNDNNNTNNNSTSRLLLPLSPLSPTDLDARPSTAPSQSTPANTQSSDFGLLFTPRVSVRRSPTLNDFVDLHIAKRPARGRRLSSASSTSKNSPSGLLSPIIPVDNANPRSPSISERRSPSARRPPASFSANGIETSFGPPPSLITRNSNYHSELAIYAQNPAASALAAQQHKSYNGKNQPSRPQRADSGTSLSAQSRDRTADWANTKAQTVLSPSPTSMKRLDSLDTVMTHNQSNAWSQGPISDMSHQSGELPTTEQQHNKKDKAEGGIESSQSSEDLFLKMALDNPEQRDTDLERRQVGRFHIWFSKALVLPRGPFPESWGGDC